jgi:subtilisin-like proprotein convertase family protein
VQQILLLSANQRDPADPDMQRNGAGLLASHNTGFGVPDSGFAVWLAKHWRNRPVQSVLKQSSTEQKTVPDNGLKLRLSSGQNFSVDIQGLPSIGILADNGTPALPLAGVGQALEPILIDLTGKGALIQRGGANFVDKINRAADAGAAFAIIYNNTGGTTVQIPGGTDYAKIPAFFISQNDGENLVALAGSDANLRGELHLEKISYNLAIQEDFSCEQVGIRVKSNYPVRGDLRITLVSPSGTRSILQKLNNDSKPGPADHVYWSTHHFFENARGTWIVEISDQFPEGEGSIQSVELTVLGTPLSEDSDLDGLPDSWEMQRFAGLAQDGSGDPDLDGFPNLLEYLLDADPAETAAPFEIETSKPGSFLRLAAPATPFSTYELLESSDLKAGFLPVGTLPAYFPQAEYFVDQNSAPFKFYTFRKNN